MLDFIFGFFSQDLGIDLGTASTLVLVKGRGIVVREPSVIAIHRKTKVLLAVGSEAKEMLGKTPQNILAIRPLRDGVISDFDSAQKLLEYFIRKTHRSYTFLPKVPRPRVVIGVPSGITEVERKAVIDAALSAGARKVYLVEQTMAAALGAGLAVEKPQASFVVDCGGGTTGIAVISLSGIVGSKSLRVAGDKLDEDVVEFAKIRYNLLLGERTAEEIKIAIGLVGEVEGEARTATMRGRDLETGLPKSFEVSGLDLREQLEKTVEIIARAVKEMVEETPPELVSDVIKNGINLVGGTSQLTGLAAYIQKYVGINCRVVKDPVTAVVRGTGLLLEEEKLLKRVALEIR